MSEGLIKKIIADKSVSLLQIKGIDSNGDSIISYLVIKDSLIEKLNYSNANRVCLDDYGTVIFGILAEDVDTVMEEKVISLFRKQLLKPT